MGRLPRASKDEFVRIQRDEHSRSIRVEDFALDTIELGTQKYFDSERGFERPQGPPCKVNSSETGASPETDEEEDEDLDKDMDD